ncbi:hypothetical protein BBK82_08290 [Lentzea guizhouensis]|uniref:Uncharacterized protein n=1 Tax=Lentzea guizhouensis TaxID=1586287 RepID=A0A1B2HEC5_9PSEU|nr:hypothetical protein [Lentzea guizhouensis]ANZ36067.1 hypothetical protein BBK82_08290 [Lentzea guizhouensis]
MIDHDEAPEMEAPADPWSALLPGQELVPAYLTSRFAAQYRVIVEVLLAEQDTSLTGLSYDEVASEVLHLDARLVRWRILPRCRKPPAGGEGSDRRSWRSRVN